MSSIRCIIIFLFLLLLLPALGGCLELNRSGEIAVDPAWTSGTVEILHLDALWDERAPWALGRSVVELAGADPAGRNAVQLSHADGDRFVYLDDSMQPYAWTGLDGTYRGILKESFFTDVEPFLPFFPYSVQQSQRSSFLGYEFTLDRTANTLYATIGVSGSDALQYAFVIERGAVLPISVTRQVLTNSSQDMEGPQLLFRSATTSSTGSAPPESHPEIAYDLERGPFKGYPADGSLPPTLVGIEDALEAAHSCHPVDTTCFAAAVDFLNTHDKFAVTAATLDTDLSADPHAIISWRFSVNSIDKMDRVHFEVRVYGQVMDTAAVYEVLPWEPTLDVPTALPLGIEAPTLSGLWDVCRAELGDGAQVQGYRTVQPWIFQGAIGGVDQRPRVLVGCVGSGGQSAGLDLFTARVLLRTS